MCFVFQSCEKFVQSCILNKLGILNKHVKHVQNTETATEYIFSMSRKCACSPAGLKVFDQ